MCVNKPPPDDLEAVRTIVSALSEFQAKDQERILRWVYEKMGLSTTTTPRAPTGDVKRITHPVEGAAPQPAHQSTDIKSFVDSKKPQSDNQFAAAVAYFFQFEAPESDRKLAITPPDLQEACRKVGRKRLKNPLKTLANAHQRGYLDKAERGAYRLNSVGENLVAMALPEGSAMSSGKSPLKRKPATKPKKKVRKG